MAPRSKKAKAPAEKQLHTSSGIRDSPVVENRSASVDELLVIALQQFIVPLVRPAVRQNDDMSRTLPSGPEAVKLVTALKDFISTVTQTGSTYEVPKVVIEVDLEEVSKQPLDVVVREEESSDSLSPKFQDKLLRSLREHVFNKMPIRLLRFEPQPDSSLQVSLVERSSVYSHLTSTIQAKLYDPGDCPTPMESEENTIKRLISKYTGYAILSHTWLRASSSEVTYTDWSTGLASIPKDSPGYQKLVNFCKTAWNDHGLALGWMDTVCINKESSAELDESIRSMYDWYKRAEVCIVYLAGTQSPADMYLDPWFTRGWTLQELLAPRVIKFYNPRWEQFMGDSDNDKRYPSVLTDQIAKATTISHSEFVDISFTSLSRRMQLAGTREVTREEDMAYSLMGIFDVSMSTAYGEGAHRAFSRLLNEILTSNSTGVLDLFNWSQSDLPYGKRQITSATRILPPSPRHYLRRSSMSLKTFRPIEPLLLTHVGLRVPVILMPAMGDMEKVSRRYRPIGKYSAIAHIDPQSVSMNPRFYHLLDSRLYVSSSNASQSSEHFHYAFAVFNIKQLPSGHILIPSMCMALCLLCFEDIGKVTSMGTFYRVDTEEPVVFEMEERNKAQENEAADNYMKALDSDTGVSLLPDDLAAQGMQLVSKYL